MATTTVLSIEAAPKRSFDKNKTVGKEIIRFTNQIFLKYPKEKLQEKQLQRERQQNAKQPQWKQNKNPPQRERQQNAKQLQRDAQPYRRYTEFKC